MKILFIMELYKPHVGGVEVLFENLINGIVKKGHEVKILTTRYEKSLKEYEKYPNGVEVYRVGTNRYNFMFFCLKQGVRLAKRADIIHTTTYNAALPSWFIGKITGKKVILTVHEIFGKLWYKFMGRKGFFYKLFEKLIFCVPYDHYICVSYYTKNCLRVYMGVPDQKMCTIYNGIDYKHRNKKTVKKEEVENIREKYNLKNHYTGLFFGRPGISKGLIYFVRSIPYITKKIPTFKAMLIVGESANNLANDVKKVIVDCNLQEYIIRIPGVKYEELKKHILAVNVVCIPSLAEGFGFAAAETCALGQNVVVTNVGSLPEVVSGKVNFVEPANEKAIAQKVIDFYQGKYEKIPEKKFLRKTTVEKTLSLYTTLLGK